MKYDFFEKARMVHGDTYAYSKVEYKGTHVKVCIICPVHGEFWQTPHNHLKGCCCPKCSIDKNKKQLSSTTEEFIRRAKLVHGDKYDYSKVEYVNANTKVCIIHKIYGEFWQTPNNHLRGHGHPLEKGEKVWNKRNRITTEEFIKRVKDIHGDKYDYSKVEYINAKTKVRVICPIHGEFLIAPHNLLNGKGCYKCGRKNSALKQSLSTKIFIEKACKIHGDKYDYSKVEYINNHTKVCIIDPVYGEFWQMPSSHLNGSSHPLEKGEKVWNKRNRITTEEFIKRVKDIHGDKYDYSKVEYNKCNEKICIICHKKDKNGVEHGEFWQTPDNHLHGEGCPKCSMSHLENEIMNYLNKNKIEYVYECGKNIFPWLKLQTLDFYLPKYNAAIECQGSQHFIPFSFGSKVKTPEKNLETIINRDKRKKKLCDKNNIKLLYYSNLGIKYPYEVFENKEKLLEKIKHG